jgi:hypothetical protein
VADDATELEKVRREQQVQLDELIAEELGRAWLRNALIWIGVVGGSGIVVIGVLVAVTGG